MDDNKRIEILTKNNKRLIEENDKLRKRIEIYSEEQEKIDILKSELENIKEIWTNELKELEEQKSKWQNKKTKSITMLTEENIAEVISSWTGIPTKKITQDENKKLYLVNLKEKYLKRTNYFYP